jgi:hypothetical protein
LRAAYSPDFRTAMGRARAAFAAVAAFLMMAVGKVTRRGGQLEASRHFVSEFGRPRGRRLAVAAVLLPVVLVWLVLASVAPARADDDSAPQVVGFSLSPKTVDTSLGEQTVTVTATVTDAGSGVQSVSVTLSAGTQSRFSWLARVSGDASSGTYSTVVTLPWGSAAGTWHAMLDLSDQTGNSRVMYWDVLDAAFGAGSAEITNAASFCDVAGPKVTGFALSPHTVNTDSYGAELDVTATITDDWAGVSMAMGVLRSPSGKGVGAALTRVAGDELSGTYTGSIPLPAGSEGGTWKLEFSLLDALGNDATISPADLDALSGAGSAEVLNTSVKWDSVPPQVTGVDITPCQVDTASSPQSATVTVSATDDSSGVARIEIALVPGISSQVVLCSGLTRISGTANDGVYQGTVSLPAGAKEGIWTPSVVLTDGSGNRAGFDADQLPALTPGASVFLTNTATADQVTIERAWAVGTAGDSATFPAGTVVTRQGGGTFAFYELAARHFTIQPGDPTGGLDGTPVGTLELGIPGLALSFSSPVAISLAVGAEYDGRQLTIHSLSDGQSTWTDEATCTVENGQARFTPDHSARFAAGLASQTVTRPVLLRLSSTSGARGATVTITGRGLGPRRAGYVKFGATKASKYLAWSPSRIKCRVPAKAKLGRLKVVVVTAVGASNARMFIVRR